MEKQNTNILANICKWRTELMGIAILWVMAFHAVLGLQEPFVTIKTLGYGGVDIFLMLSGVGMYYSLRKCDDVGVFYAKRVRRILPSYLPFIIVWCIWTLNRMQMEPMEKIKVVFGNLFMTGWINDVSNQFNWYVQVICWFYLLSPIIYQIIIRCKNRWQEIGILLVGFAITLPFLGDIQHLMGAARIPIFLLGMLWAHESQKTKSQEMRKTTIWALRIGVVLIAIIGIFIFLKYYVKDVNILWLYGLWWYPFILITPGLCYVISLIFNLLERIKVFKVILAPLKYIGIASFEIYLLHIDLFKEVINTMIPYSNMQWGMIILGSAAIGIIYHYLIEGIMKGVNYLKERKISMDK